MFKLNTYNADNAKKRQKRRCKSEKKKIVGQMAGESRDHQTIIRKLARFYCLLGLSVLGERYTWVTVSKRYFHAIRIRFKYRKTVVKKKSNFVT